MWEPLLATENLLFSIPLALMLFIGILEGLAAIGGMSGSSVLDGLLPDADAGHVDTGLGKLLGWLRIREVPVLMLLVIFLACFGTLGLFFQAGLKSLTGHYLPAWLPGLPVLILSLFLTRFFGGILRRILPKDETRAVSRTSLIGKVAVVTLGTASKGHPAEAKARDEHGQTHYFLVEPDNESDVFQTGDAVLLVSLNDHLYRAIPNPSSLLSHSP
ncbi:YqiJ family protein [Desulfobotulus sp.]|jgi:hypothetical protein|uniref:YqiJ family protein n=1 Tax=Desulfobotulus sp. TaxID=1940337 RepID=UPI002A359A9D|nr:YqiJ family protein [Desulfobotulus sp.]MDY0162838.1 YqiJ family protein [Desulfobotulus sp.]